MAGKTGGRPSQDPNAADKISKAQKDYRKKPGGRKAQKEYEQTEKGKETHSRYHKTEGAKLAHQRWLKSKKGREFTKRQKDRTEEFKRIEAWLEANPGKTLEDYGQE